MAAVIRNALTVDVEEYFQVAAFERTIPRDALGRSRVARRIQHRPCARPVRSAGRARARSSCLAGSPSAIPRWCAASSRKATNSRAMATTTPASTSSRPSSSARTSCGPRRSSRTSAACRCAAIAPRAIRSTRKNLWALDVLQETGHVYSSSIYPIRHDLYGMPDAPRFPFRFRPDGILEIPVTTVRMGGRNYPCGGGGYFRLLPYGAFRWMLQARERAGPAVRAVLLPPVGGRSRPAARGRARRSSPGSGTT